VGRLIETNGALDETLLRERDIERLAMRLTGATPGEQEAVAAVTK
jgi:hypothetical protein